MSIDEHQGDKVCPDPIPGNLRPNIPMVGVWSSTGIPMAGLGGVPSTSSEISLIVFLRSLIMTPNRLPSQL